MVDNNVLKIIDIQLKGNIKDVDVIADLKYVGEILEKNMKILSSFEKYQKEILNKNLEFNAVHSEKFFKEHIKRFEENDFQLVDQLVEFLNSDNPQNAAIACNDLGEFCRFHPFGRNILEKNKAKATIMILARSENSMVREHALLAL